MHQQRLKTLSPGTNVELAIKVFRRDKHDLLAPVTRDPGIIHPPGVHAATADAVQFLQPSAHKPRRRPLAACPRPIATPVAIEDALVSEPGDFLFDGPEKSPSSRHPHSHV